MTAATPAPTPKPRTPAKTLAGVLGSVGAALALFGMIPAEESGRTVKATVAPTGAITIKHVSGKQYLKAYLDAVGVATACDGIATKDIKLGQTYTEAQCTTMLERELIVHAEGVIKCIPGVYGRTNQAVAIVSLAYNIGVSMVCKSSIARFWNAGQWRAGCDFFPRYRLAGGRVLPGLVARRARERAICLKELPR
ncbi:lysozyme [Sphingomonas sp. PP-F2F-G114-C0414]|uniref:lysozyme n=1 Tax=Sphingomonas sp. PP-F2F-G114-C0414 TaxID=2135662 RepID=UPI000F0F1AF6|nr:lysozyme [Sphingomonas sp. PP-F2F-G114-C0414]RMB26256.1 lysozyme [Sphingomonas sp. PP-F2F-G114-C0414]